MTVDDWHDSTRHALGLLLSPSDGTHVLLLMNAEPHAVEFMLPAGRWSRRVDSATGEIDAVPITTATVHVAPHAMCVFTAPTLAAA